MSANDSNQWIAFVDSASAESFLGFSSFEISSWRDRAAERTGSSVGSNFFLFCCDHVAPTSKPIVRKFDKHTRKEQLTDAEQSVRLKCATMNCCSVVQRTSLSCEKVFKSSLNMRFFSRSLLCTEKCFTYIPLFCDMMGGSRATLFFTNQRRTGF